MPEHPDPARLAQIRERHYRAPWGYADKPPDAPHPCYGCGFEWPCETTVVLAALTAAEQERDAAQLQAQANADTANLNWQRGDELQQQLDAEKLSHRNAVLAYQGTYDELETEYFALKQRVARLEALAQAARVWASSAGLIHCYHADRLHDAVAALDDPPVATDGDANAHKNTHRKELTSGPA